jgi:transposase InsO family protein
MDEMKEKTAMPYGAICKALHLPWSNFKRWRSRMRSNAEILRQPGPKKVEPFNPSFLDDEIRLLHHGRSRSTGTTALYQRHRFSVSRRELGRMLEQVRHDLRRHLRRIEWSRPRVAWAIDGTEYNTGSAGKIHLYNMQDLGSRYKFLPLVGLYPVGEEIAGYLAEKFDRYGAPLVLKRDNGGNLNHLAVNQVLEEFLVLPLNSPEYYAPYNGAIEESQRELKKCLREKVAPALTSVWNHMGAYAEAGVNELNHRIRPCLNGGTSCQAFFASNNTPSFTKRERREIYDTIMERVERILSAMNQSGQIVRESAWRIAMESWLRSKDYIKVSTNPKVSPDLFPFLAHK